MKRREKKKSNFSAHSGKDYVPPRIYYVSSNGRVEVKKGSPVRLECKASGNPVPKITWSRKNNLLPNGEQTAVTPVLSLENVDRHQAGVYQCTSSNGVGEDVTQQIVLHVLCKFSNMKSLLISHLSKSILSIIECYKVLSSESNDNSNVDNLRREFYG
ncbi:hypothetical protein WA026_012997 [Henosepilachna vigintioctopunctata]|uniref:Ig-like domain-containing protein n=1 Tax=Henosepilachna vigintioctopunctata TaxID=420089 RepID=A0AAW1TK90_9CUCU